MVAGTRDQSTEDLEGLRDQLTNQLGLLLIVAACTGMWALLRVAPLPPIEVALLVMTMACGLQARALKGRRPDLARHILAWGPTIALLIGMWLLPYVWLPFLGLSVALIGAVLVPRSGVITAAATLVLAIVLVRAGIREYSLLGLGVALTLGAVVTELTLGVLYTVLEWLWTMERRAGHLLDVARDRQGELSRTLKSLELAYRLQHRTQQELIVARRQADEARRAKEQFAANISHDLRTPLNIILGFSEVMYQSPEVYGQMRWPPTLRRDVFQIYRSSRHLLEMIDDILDLSRFEMVGFALNREPMQIEPLLRETVDMVQDLYRGQPVSLEVEVAQGLPILELDRVRIRQVLLNLLNNARRFTERGTVRVEARRANGEVIVSISDTGIGIPADELPRIFEEFHQVDPSLRRAHGGAGLGLAICQHLVLAHEGRIWVESELGSGSTFSFALPIPGQHAPTARVHSDDSVDRLHSDDHPCVVVVDTDPQVATLLGRHLEGHEVVHARNVQQATEHKGLHHPHAVILNAPPGSRSASAEIPGFNVPIIECSLPSQAWVARDLAVTASLSKPTTAQDLLAELDKLDDVHDILIVDNDRAFCHLVRRFLETSGRSFAVRHALDGEEGLRALRTHRPDLLLLDLLMPGVDGFQVLEEMRKEPDLADLRVVLLTAFSYAEDYLARSGGHVSVNRPGGLSLDETIRCLKATMAALESR